MNEVLFFLYGKNKKIPSLIYDFIYGYGSVCHYTIMTVTIDI